MTIVTAEIADITGRPDNTRWEFLTPVRVREGSVEGSIITDRVRLVQPLDGSIRVELDPGPATIKYDGNVWEVTIPEEDSSLWDIISAAVAVPPDTALALIGSAVSSWLQENPPSGDIEVDNISDAGEPGKAALLAETQAGAREAIGAGTSSLAIGTSGSTAKAGNWVPAAADVSDSTSTGRAVLTGDAAAGRTALSVVGRGDRPRNILDYGVEIEAATSQTAAIKAALNAYPGATFVFPRGNYRAETELAVDSNNTIQIDHDARIYAAAPMDTLINYDNGEASVGSFAQDRGITGAGTLDANLLADTALRVSRVIRFELNPGLTIVDPLHRGLVAASPGAEVQAAHIRIHNTGTTNVVDNVGIEATMNDCRFSHISMRDMTIGVLDTGANTWMDIHPWLGDTAQLTERYENSVGFVIGGNSVLINPYADTYRYSFRSDAAAGYGVARIIAPEVYGNPGNLTNELAALYPGVVFDMADDGGAFSVTNARFVGHPVTPFALVAGESKRLTIRSAGLVASNITGYTGLDDYIRGVLQGNSSFTPTIYGASTAGTHTYTVQEGRMEVRDGRVSYLFKVKATLDNTISGKLLIGGLPFPVGADSVNVGGGAITYSAGGTGAGAAIGASGSSGPLNAIVTAVDGGMVELLSRAANLTPVTTAEIEATPFQEQLIELWGQIDCTYNYKTW